MGNNKNKVRFDNFMQKAKSINYERKLRSMQKDFSLSDGQYDILIRHLNHIFCTPTIKVYVFNQERGQIVKNKELGMQIYLVAKEFIDNNRILLNKEIKD